jgi:hypothetical protein
MATYFVHEVLWDKVFRINTLGDVYGEGSELLAAALRYRSISLKNRAIA